jgi:hypothetical protein
MAARQPKLFEPTGAKSCGSFQQLANPSNRNKPQANPKEKPFRSKPTTY